MTSTQGVNRAQPFDDQVVDLRESTAQGGGSAETEPGEVIIDLRDPALAGRTLVAGPHVSGRPPALRDGHRVEVITGGDLWMKAEAFVYDRYVKIGFTHESSRQQVEELARWSDASRFHAVLSEDDAIIGTMRTILGKYSDLPVGQFERTDFEDPDPVCELSSLVVDESVRSSGVMEHLFRAGWADTTRLGATAIVGLVDAWLLEAFRHTYGMPFVPIGLPHWHMGGNVVPVTMSVKRPAMAEIARNNPHFWLWNLEVMRSKEIDRFDIGDLVDPRVLADLRGS